MQNQRWMDRISAMTVSSQKSSQPLSKKCWKISIGEISWENCVWSIIKRTILQNPMEDFIIWYRETDKSIWEKVVSTHIDSQCACGRSWIEKNNTIFAFRGELYQDTRTYEAKIAWLNAPLKCKYCYYVDQHSKGNWAPKSVLKELGLNAK